MGTSTSSSGPSGNVSLIPPWVEDETNFPVLPLPDDEQEPEEEQPLTPPDDPPPLAPPRRFASARYYLGQFAESGSEDRMKRGVGRYVRTGLGGSRRASQRMAGTARTASALYGVLHALSRGVTPEVDLGFDPAHLAGRPAREIVDRIAEALSPSDGSQDSEVRRNSISQALRELIRRQHTADLTALTEDQIQLAIELFISADVNHRIELDVGRTVFSRAPSPAAAVRRLQEMYRYVRQVVAAFFRRRPENSEPLTQQVTTSFANNVIRNTFEVFESYL